MIEVQSFKSKDGVITWMSGGKNRIAHHVHTTGIGDVVEMYHVYARDGMADLLRREEDFESLPDCLQLFGALRIVIFIYDKNEGSKECCERLSEVFA